jgi:alkylhydroperoxidase family enzyme
MGHSEMLLAVAGLKEEEVKQRTEKLASGDWSDFPPAERAAFQFAYKLTREPRAVADADVKSLVGRFGEHRAIDLIWYTGWCNYMTRVADAFQLPLEHENVFARPAAKESKTETKSSP